jgi:hypothetical protein
MTARKDAMLHRVALALPTALLLLTAVGCSAPPAPTSTDAGDAPGGHGAIAGAEEVPEPPVQLLSIDATGAVGLLDLLGGASATVGRIGTPQALASDGRYAFVSTAGGVEIVDSGVWSWNHGDHFHYYRAEPRVLGLIAGEGPATVVTGMLSTAGSTGIFFPGSGEAVLLSNAALSEGEIEELFRLDAGEGPGLVAPLGDGAVVAHDDAVRLHAADGTATDEAACVGPRGAITTRVGLVVGCADGALIATADGPAAFERVPYPEGADAERAAEFDGRKGRPTVAAVAGDAGFWLLDTRARTWAFVPTDAPLVRAVAVDDADGHVVGMGADGRIRVFLADTGEQVGATDALVADPRGAGLVVDAQRAYVNDPDGGVVHEIDYADGARIARSLETPTEPVLFTEVGR